MTFHEKSRWIAFLSNLLVWAWYFTTLARALAAGAPETPGLLAIMIPAILAITVINIVGHIAVALWRPREARSTMDERERAIARAGAGRAYYLLQLGLIAVIGASFFRWNQFLVVNGLVFVLIAADTARYALEIAAYRRGVA